MGSNKLLIAILAEVARMERKTIRERVESGYKNYRANGGRVGRKEGIFAVSQQVTKLKKKKRQRKILLCRLVSG